MPKMTIKQRAFTQAFVSNGFNATQAAITAGYPKRSAQRVGSENLSKPVIAQFLAELMSAAQARVEVDLDRVLIEVARIAFADIRHYVSVGAGGIRLKDSSDWTDDQAAAVKKVSETHTLNGGSQSLDTHDKLGALKLLMEHLVPDGDDDNLVGVFTREEIEAAERKLLGGPDVEQAS